MNIRIVSFVLLAALLLLGFRLSGAKPLWNDEIYSQISSIEQTSVSHAIAGHIGEGNNTPLFYLMQKGVCQLVGYRSPPWWIQGDKFWDRDTLWDRYVLRISPICCTALAMTLIFYFFAQYYSLALAAFSVFLCLSSPMLWNYWAEARPYSLWVLLSTIQVLLFLGLLQSPTKTNPFMLLLLSCVHVALALTIVLSLPQILSVTILLWMFNIREKKFLIWGSILPFVIAMFYYFQAPKYPFGLIFSFEQYIRAHISRDRFYILLIVILLFLLERYLVKKKAFGLKFERVPSLKPMLSLFALLLAAAVGILLLFKWQAGLHMQFPVTEKYFMFLTPLGIIATTLAVQALWTGIKPLWVKSGMLCLVAGLTIPKFIKVINEVREHYPQF